MNLKDKINSYRETTSKTLPQIANEARISLGNLYQWSRGKETDMTEDCKRLISYIDGIAQSEIKSPIQPEILFKEKIKPVTPLAIKITQFQQHTGQSIVDIARGAGVSKENVYKWVQNAIPRRRSDCEKIERYLNQIGDKIEIIPSISLAERITKLQERSGKSLPRISREANVNFSSLALWKRGTKPRMTEQYKRFISYLDKMETIIAIEFANDIPVKCTSSRSQHDYGGLTIGEIIETNIEQIIQVSGESMEPTFKAGSKLAVSQIPNQSMIVWGDYHYIVYKSSIRLIRRIYPMNNGEDLRLEAEQIEKYPPIIQNWNEIDSIYKIQAVITVL